MASNPSTIKAIDKTSVHRICSGQVVLNLAVAVKELIENSLDAGATIVNVRLKDYGSELLEVTDNGSGVHPDNFQGLTLKHHTSKLRDFSDLESVCTFGFRGEALSSLCALSKVTISTKHTSQDVGTCLTFEHTGAIASSNHIPRQVGTTVSLVNLFSTLPVRQKEFHRNLKKEFNKMTQLLNAYCLVSTGVKITCTNQTSKGSKTTFVSTLGCPTVKENISSVFGPKQLTNLLELKTVRPSVEVLEEMKIDADMADMFKLDGYISSCAHGCGRSTNDRQFYYINSRPCEPSKVIKAVNEVYHQYNVHQVPFVYMNIKVERTCVDVNVTPDKRQVFLDQEKLLISTVKASLSELYEKIPSTYSVNSLKRPLSSVDISPVSSNKPSLSKFSQFRHHLDTKRDSPQNNSSPVQKAKQMKLDNHISFSRKEGDDTTKGTNSNLSSLKCEILEKSKLQLDDTTKGSNSNLSLFKCEILEKSKLQLDSDSKTDQLNLETRSAVALCSNNDETNVLNCAEGNKVPLTDSRENPEEEISSEMEIEKEVESANNGLEETLGLDSVKKSGEDIPNIFVDRQNDNIEMVKIDCSESKIFDKNEIDNKSLNCNGQMDSNNIDENIENDISEKVKQSVTPDESHSIHIDSNNDIPDRKVVNVDLNIDKLKKSIDEMKEARGRIDNPNIKFRTTIDPTKNAQAEQELSREISKDMFSQMEIVGQFNLGFIITKLGSDLFIVDQHATDEKYNFETLQLTTSLSNQKLVVPQNLELTAANECLLIENLEVFHKNGFDFKIDENEVVSKRVKLSAIPMSKNWIFGKEDVDELLFMLQDVAAGTMCRPSRVRSMFASRACRMSVMIGSHLSFKEMRRLVDHMGQIEQPWNCPHGRPTMRHLINLELTN